MSDLSSLHKDCRETSQSMADIVISDRCSRRLRYRLRREMYLEGAGEARSLDTSAAAVDPALRKELIDVKAENEALRAQTLRARADFENLRKRVTREREEQRRFANESLIKGLLETVDNLDRAIQGAERSGDVKALHSGVEMVHRQFMASLKTHGVETVPAEPGMKFDPNFHEAVAATPHPEFENDVIVECLQAGYVLNGRVLRAAMVRVARN